MMDEESKEQKGIKIPYRNAKRVQAAVRKIIGATPIGTYKPMSVNMMIKILVEDGMEDVVAAKLPSQIRKGATLNLEWKAAFRSGRFLQKMGRHSINHGNTCNNNNHQLSIQGIYNNDFDIIDPMPGKFTKIPLYPRLCPLVDPPLTILVDNNDASPPVLPFLPSTSTQQLLQEHRQLQKSAIPLPPSFSHRRLSPPCQNSLPDTLLGVEEGSLSSSSSSSSSSFVAPTSSAGLPVPNNQKNEETTCIEREEELSHKDLFQYDTQNTSLTIIRPSITSSHQSRAPSSLSSDTSTRSSALCTLSVVGNSFKRKLNDGEEINESSDEIQQGGNQQRRVCLDKERGRIILSDEETEEGGEGGGEYFHRGGRRTQIIEYQNLYKAVPNHQPGPLLPSSTSYMEVPRYSSSIHSYRYNNNGGYENNDNDKPFIRTHNPSYRHDIDYHNPPSMLSNPYHRNSNDHNAHYVSYMGRPQMTHNDAPDDGDDDDGKQANYNYPPSSSTVDSQRPPYYGHHQNHNNMYNAGQEDIDFHHSSSSPSLLSSLIYKTHPYHNNHPNNVSHNNPIDNAHHGQQFVIRRQDIDYNLCSSSSYSDPPYSHNHHNNDDGGRRDGKEGRSYKSTFGHLSSSPPSSSIICSQEDEIDQVPSSSLCHTSSSSTPPLPLPGVPHERSQISEINFVAINSLLALSSIPLRSDQDVETTQNETQNAP